MRKKIFIFLFTIEFCLLFAENTTVNQNQRTETGKQKYLRGLNSFWETKDDISFKKYLYLWKPDLSRNFRFQNIDYINSFLIYDNTDFESLKKYYSYYFFNERENNLRAVYTITKNAAESTIDMSCYKDGNIFSLETNYDMSAKQSHVIDSMYVTKRTAESKEVIKSYKINPFNKPENQFIIKMTVDEDKEKVFFTFSDAEKNINTLRIFSLNSGAEVFSHATDLTGDIFTDDLKVYFSEQNKIYSLDYSSQDFTPVEICTFVPDTEKIWSIAKYDDLYVIISEFINKKKTENKIYVCRLQNNEFVKITELQEE